MAGSGGRQHPGTLGRLEPTMGTATLKSVSVDCIWITEVISAK
jgi:hypothetical protein